jgi:hypothetical protein
MGVVVHARVTKQFTRLRLRYVAERLNAVLSEAARTECWPQRSLIDCSLTVTR